MMGLLVVFEFCQHEYWRGQYLACEESRREQCQSEQQHQPSQQKSEYLAFGEIPTPIEARSYDLPPQHINRAQLFLGLPCSETPKSSRNNLVSVYEINAETIRAWFSPSFPRIQHCDWPQSDYSRSSLEKPYSIGGNTPNWGPPMCGGTFLPVRQSKRYRARVALCDIC